jgi:alpha-mannosidase
MEAASLKEQLLFFGMGNHGGGPTKQNIEMITKFNEDPSYLKIGICRQLSVSL